MGTIVGSTGATCNVAASDSAINAIPNLRNFLSTSLDTAVKAKKTISQASKILDKQVKTIATNPKKYTPQALQQCTVDLQKATTEAPNVDVLESLTDTGYMPPDPGNPISVTPQEVQIANYAGPSEYSTPDIQTIVNGMKSGDAKLKTVYGESYVNNGYWDVKYFDKPTQGPSFDPETGQLEPQQGSQFLEINGKLYAPNNSWGFFPVQDVKYDADGNAIVTDTGQFRIRTRADNNVFNEITFQADPETGQITQYNPNVYQTGSNAGTGFFGGLQEIMNSPVGMIAMSFVAPGLGSLIAEEFALAGIEIPSSAANAIAKASINIAAGQDPAKAIGDAITGAVIQTGSQSVASDIQKGVQAITDDKYYALLVGGAIASSISSAVTAAAKGGSTDDIIKAAAAGATGSAAATETDSRALGQAIAGALTGGTMGAATGFAGALVTDAAKGGATTTPGGVPLPPGGKVGVTWSVDGSGNALVQYEDGTTANVKVDPSVQPGTSVSVDPTTNVATIATPSPISTGGEQVAGPGGMTAQTVASMPQFQPRAGETAGDVTPLGSGSYMRQFSSTNPDGTVNTYEVYYHPDNPEGAQIQYAVPMVIDKQGNVTSQGYQGFERPDFGGAPSTALPEAGVAKIAEAYKTFAVTGQWPPGVLNDPDVKPYVDQYRQTGQWSREVFNAIQGTAPGWQRRYSGGGVGATGGETAPTGPIQTEIGAVPGLETFTQPAGAAGGTAGTEVPSTTPQVISIPDQFGQVPGAGGTIEVRDRQIMDLTGITGGEFAGEGNDIVLGGGTGGGTSTGVDTGTGAVTGGGGVDGGAGGVEPPPETPPPEEAPPKEEETAPTKDQTPYLITGGISPRMQARAPRGVQTALQTPFTSSLITSGLTSYRGAGEIESPESGKRRSNVWNEASLRLKDALGI